MPFQFRKEAIEEDLNRNFPSQGQGNPPLYYSLSEVVVPTYSINNTAEGSGLPEMLQTAWDFGTSEDNLTSVSAQTVINTTGFWKINVVNNIDYGAIGAQRALLQINDGVTAKQIWRCQEDLANPSQGFLVTPASFVVFLRSGDELQATVTAGMKLSIVYRQIADVNGNLVNPLGFSFA